MWNASPTDPKTHEAAATIARRCVSIISSLLRDGEQIEAVREFYCVAREEIEKLRENHVRP